MTEKEAWLELAKKACTSGNGMFFLCTETKDLAPNGLCDQMLYRLELFNPRHDTGRVWWNFTEDNETPTELDNQRATACCFLAAMAEEEASYLFRRLPCPR